MTKHVAFNRPANLPARYTGVVEGHDLVADVYSHSAMKRGFKRDLKARTFLAGTVGALVLLANASPVAAGPKGASVVAGSVVVTGQGTASTVVNQATNKAIIDWTSFSIGVDESVRYNQPNAGSISLNRVTGGDASQILGSLTANGQVWLINPAGVAFGSDATVDVSGLVATTTNISNDDFFSGNYNFNVGTADRGAIVANSGDINIADGGMLAFVGPGVANSGVINARLGQVALASGDAFAFDLYGDQLVNLTASSQDIAKLTGPDGTSLAARLVQDGQIKADGGHVQLSVNSARSLVDNSINMTGIVQARSVSSEGGSIILSGGDNGIVRVTGTLDASGQGAGEVGGTVKVLGDKVGIFESAVLDASGDAGGGEILVGGNMLGQGPEQNASQVVVSKTALIDADALTDGDGGRVIVWSDNYTGFFGTVTAIGGAIGGDGGFIETSSKGHLVSEGFVDASAVAGEGGEWLLDPRNIIISTVDNATTNDGGGTNTFTADNDDGVTASTINAATINGVLNAGTSVTVSTTGAGNDAGNITINTAINKTNGGNATLTLTADNNIIISAGTGIDSTVGQLTVDLNAGADSSISANITTNGGNFFSRGTTTVGADVIIDTGAGGATFTGAVDGGQALVVNSTGATLFSAAVGGTTALTSLITNAGGTVNLQAVTTTGVQTYTENATLNGTYTTTNNQFTVTGTTTLGGATTVTTGSGGVTFTGVVDGGNTLAVDTTGATLFSAAVGGTTALTSLITNVGGTVNLQAVTTTGVQTYGENATLNGTYTTTNNQFTVTGTTTLGGATTVTTGSGGVTFTGAVDGANTLAVDTTGATLFSAAAGGTTALTSLITNAGGSVSLQNVTTTGVQTYGDATATLNGAYATTNNNFTVSGAATIAADTTVNTNTGIGNISFASIANGAAFDLALTSGTGTVAASGAVSVTDLTLNTTGGSTFGGSVTVNDLVVTANANAVTLNGAANTFVQQVDFANTAGTVTFGNASTDQSTFNGGLTVSGNQATAVQGTITTSNNTVNFGTGAMTLGAASTVTTGSGAVTFGGTVDGGNTLAVDTTGATLFSAAVGGTTALTSLITNAGGTVNLQAVTTTGVQTYTENATLNGTYTTTNNQFTVTGTTTLGGATTVTTGSGGVTFTGAVDGANTLAVDTTGATLFSAAAGGTTALTSLITNAGGTVNLQAVTTTGVQTYTENATLNGTYTTTNNQFTVTGTTTLGGATTVTTGSGGVTFTGAVDGANTLAVDTTGATLFSAAAGGTTALTSLITNAGGSVSLQNVATTGVQTYGDATATLNGAYATTNNNFTVSGAATIAADTTVNTNTGIGNISFASIANGAAFDLALTSGTGTVAASGAVSVTDLTLNTTGGSTFGGSVTVNDLVVTANANAVTLNGAANTFVQQVDFANTAGTVTFGNASTDQSTFNGGLTVSGNQATAVQGTITTSNDTVNFGTGAMTLGAASTVTTGSGAVTFGGTVDGGNTLAVDTTGATLFSAAVGGTTALTSLITNAGGTVNLQAVTTTGVQTYTENATLNGTYTTTNNQFTVTGTTTLGGATTVTTGSGGVTFTGAVDGANTLAVDTTGATLFSAAVGGTTALTSLITNAGGTVNLQAVTTTGVQTYTENATLNGTYTTTNNQFTVTGTTTLGGATTVTTGSGGVTFTGAVDGANTLAVDTTGATLFSAAAGGTTALTSLITNAGGTVNLQAVTTTGVQTYTENATLNGTYTTTNNQFTVTGTTTLGGATTVTTGSGGVTFTGAVDGANTLAVDTTGATLFSAAAGGTTALTSLITNAGGSVSLQNVTTTGVQTYGDATATLNGAYATTNNNFTVSGAATIAADTTVNTNTGIGNISFASIANGAAFDLALTSGTGTVAASGAVSVTDLTLNTTGGSTFGGSVTVNDLVVTANANAVTLNGAANTFVQQVDFANTAGTVTFGNASTDQSTFNDGLTVSGNQATAVQGTITTSNDTVNFGTGAMTLGAASTVTTGSGAVTFGGTVDGANTLAVDTTGATLFSAAVGGTTALTSLITNAGGTVNLQAVTTTGVQTYTENATLNGTYTTTNNQFTVTGTTTLGGATTVTTGSGGVTFTGAVDGANTLAVDTTGATLFSAAAGGTTALTSLITNAGGSVSLQNVTTTGVQTYGDATATLNGAYATTNNNFTVSGAATIAADTTVNTGAAGIGNISFASIANGAAFDLALTSGTGTVAASGAVSVTDLTLNTTGGSTFGGSVTVNDLVVTANANAVTLNGAANTFVQQVDFANTAGTVTFGNASTDQSTFNDGLTVSGNQATAVQGTITTSNDTVNFGTGAMTLGAASTVTTGSGAVTFGGTVDGANTLAVDTTGATLFSAAAGGTTALTSLITNAGGSVSLQNVTTTGVQTYGDATATLNGAYATTNNNFTVSGAATIAADTTVNTNTGIGNISFASIANGAAFDLALTSGTGTVAASGAVSVTDLTLNTTGGSTFGGSVTVNDLVVTANANAVTLNGAANTFVQQVDFANTAGTVTFGNASTDQSTFNDGLTVSGNQATAVQGTITTSNDTVNFGTGAMTLGAASTVTTGSGAVTFGGTVDGGNTLAVDTTGATLFSAAVGGTTALTSLITNAGGTVNLQAVTTTGVQTYTENATLNGTYTTTNNQFTVTGTTTLGGATTVTTGSGGVTFTGAVDGANTLAVDTTGATLFSAAAGGTTALTSLITNAGGSVSLQNVTTSGVQTYGDATATLDGTYTTTNSNVTVSGAATLASTVNITTGAGAGNISIAAVTDSGNSFDLVLTAGGGNITGSGTVSLDDLELISGTSAAFADSVTVGDVVTRETGAMTVTFNGAANTFVRQVDFENTGRVTIGDAGNDSATFNGGLTFTANAPVTLAGTVASSNDVVNFGSGGVTLAAATIVSTGSGSVTFPAVVDGGQTLTINTTGAAAFEAAVGATTPLTSLTTNAGGTASVVNVTTTGAQLYGEDTRLNGAYVTTNSAFTVVGTTTLGGNTTITTGAGAGDITFAAITDGAGTFNLGLTAGGGAIAVSQTTAVNDLTLTSGASAAFTGNVTVNDFITTGFGAGTVTLNGLANTFAAAVDFENTGAVTLGNAVTDASTFDAGVAFSGNSTVALQGTIKTSGDAVTFGTSAVTLGSDSIIDTTNQGVSAGGGNIVFGGNVANGAAFDLELIGGTGGAITVAGATSVTDLTLTSGASAAFTGNVTINDMITTTFGAGTVTLNGTANTFAAAVDFENTGAVTLGNGGGDQSTFNGGLAFSGNSAVAVQGTIATSNDTVNFGTGAMTLGAALTITTGSGAVTFGGTVDGGQTLAVNSTGATLFSAAAGGTTALTSLITNAGGTVNLQSVTTTGVQTYGENATLNGTYTTTNNQFTVTGTTTLGGATTVTTGSGGVTFTGAVDGANTLAVDTTGATLFSAAVGGTTALTSLITNAGGTVNLQAVTTTGVQTYTENATLNGTYTTTNNQFTVTGTTTLGGATTVTTGSGGVTFTGAVDGANTLAVDTTGATLFSAAAGGTTALTSLITNAGGTVNLQAVTTTGVQTYTENATLNGTYTTTNNQFTVTGTTTLGGATTVTTGSGGVTFTGAVDGANTLAVDTTGATLFSAAAGGTTALTSLITNAGGSVSLQNVTTTGVQTYGDATATLNGAYATTNNNFTVSGAATIAADTTVNTNTGIGNISFASIANGAAFDLALTSGTGTVAASGAVSVTDLTLNTTGGSTFGGSVTVNDLVVTANANAVTLNGAANTFVQQVDFANTAGTVTFGNASTDQSTFNGGLTVSGNQATAVQGTITTSNDTVNFGTGAMTLGAASTVTTGSGAVTFGGTVDGGNTLAVDTTGATLFSAAVGGTTALTSLITNAGGTVNLQAVTTTGVQTYTENATLNGTYTTTNNQFTVTGTTTLGGATTVTTGSGGVTFTGAVDGANTLAVDTTGATLFSAAAGGTTALTSLITNAGGTVNLQAVTTTGVQTYTENATLNGTYTTTNNQFTVTGTTTLGGATTVTTGSGGVTFTGAVDGANTLAVDTTGATLFSAAAGGTTALTSLITNAGGSVSLQNVTTTGVQTYGDATATLNGAYATTNNNFTVSGAATIAADTTVNTNTGIGNISFASIANGAAFDLALTSGTGTVAASGAVSVTDLTLNTTGGSTFGGSVTVNDLVVTANANAVTLNGAANTFVQQVDFANTAGTVTFGNASTDQSTFNGGLTVSGNQATAVQGTITTSNDTVNFGTGAMTLGAASTVTTGSGAVTFGGTVDGGNTLAVDTTGATLFSAAVGGTTALTSLITNAGGSVSLQNVTTTGVQTYGDATATLNGAYATTNNNFTVSGAATIAADTTVNTNTGIGNISFASIANGAAFDLALTSGTGTVAASGAVSVTDLTLNTTGGSTFGGSVTVNDLVVTANANAVTLNGAANTFVQQVDFANTAGTVTFGNASTDQSTFNGGLTVSGNQATAVQGTITTSNDTVNFGTGAMTLGAASTVTTGSGAVTFGGTVDGGNTLAVDTTGATLFSAAVGGTTALTSLITNAGGSVSLQNVTTSGVQTYGDATATLDGAYATTNNNFTVSGAATIAADTTVNTDTGGGNISFASIPNSGAFDLALAAGTGAITNSGTTQVRNLTISSTSNAQLTGRVTLSAAFDFTGTALTLSGAGNVVATSMEVTNSGLFTTADAADLTVTNEFVQNGAGTNTIGDDITSTADGIAFATAVTLTSTDAVTFQTGEAAGDDIVLSGALTGTDDNLTFDAGSAGDLTVGGTTALGTGNLIVRDADILNFGTTSAATIALTANDVATGTYTATTTATIDATLVRAITLSAGTTARIEASDNINQATVTAANLTVRGNNSVVLINTAVNSISGGQVFEEITLLEPTGLGRYTVNAIPFGPERAGIIENVVTAAAGLAQIAPSANNAANDAGPSSSGAGSAVLGGIIAPYQFSVVSADVPSPVFDSFKSFTFENPVFGGPQGGVNDRSAPDQDVRQ